MKTREILLVNDDGVHSPGLLALKKKMEKLGKVVVVTPETERSGAGKAVSTCLIKVKKTMLADGTKAYAIDGTPADACLLALFKILKHPPSLVVSGINLGPNLGIDDLLTSGTLGAALEAAIHKIPAIAVSYSLERIRDCEGNRREKIGLENLDRCAELAKQTAEHVLKHGMPEDVDLISINVPEKPSSKMVEVTTLSCKGYADIFAEKAGGYKIREWILNDYPYDEAGTDLHAVRENRHISITPIKLNFTHQKQSLEELARFLGERGYKVRF
ncbi:5'/3'-nucleotidase SurE [Candidatus Bathyarchaeota archaeon]|nr:5'/3'-nucleotidase SurE [Candidatus Bathyarchaeota archaeon]